MSILDCGAILIAKQKNQNTLFALREKIHLCRKPPLKEIWALKGDPVFWLFGSHKWVYHQGRIQGMALEARATLTFSKKSFKLSTLTTSITQ